MKSISAAMIVAVAAALLFGSAFIAHHDTALFIKVVWLYCRHYRDRWLVRYIANDVA